MTTKSNGQLIDELQQFTGDIERYRSLSPSLIYTPGIQHLAREAECYWLIDAIASYVPSRQLRKAIKSDPRIGVLHFWKLELTGKQSADLTARVDSGEPPFIAQRIPFTDFPLPHIELWCGYDGRCWTLYLPSEH